ncbi:hypothetical protein M9Y10_005345 [Tritrichomonas musculus]|uniref:HAT C-terminal dimerisation domain-containing protein n=1 Tax=Tritrichomonas musculus TaxID=1915356 RepID=A0ABR2JLB8_9EUKA
MTLPAGSELLIKTLLSIDNANTNPHFKANVKNFAKHGIIYVGHPLVYSYCPFCKEKKIKRYFFTNENSHYAHSEKCEQCIEFKKYFEMFNNQILDMIADFLASYQISINALCSIKFSNILQYSNPLIKIIKKSDIRKHIYILFNKYNSEINYQNVGEFASILIDGASRNLKNFYAFILFTKSRLFYIKISKMDKATSENISQVTKEIINYLNNVLNIEVISICTDHAANMVKAFNALDQISCQKLADTFFEWIGCTCHLLNLSISDLEKNTEFINIKNTLLFILSLSQKMEFPHKVPTFSKTRWDSFSKCFNFSLFYKDRIFPKMLSVLYDLLEKKNIIEQKIQRNQFSIDLFNQYISVINEISIHQKYIQTYQSNEFEELTTIFTYMSNLINKIGSNNFLLCQVFPEFILLKDFFSTLTTKDNKKFSEIILNRILNAKEYIQAAASFLFTSEGHNYFLCKLNEEEKEDIISKIKSYLLKYNYSKFGDNEDLLSEQFEKYLKMPNFGETDPFDFWNNLRQVSGMNRLAELAIRILNMPCSEAAVERLFSHLKFVFGKKNYNKSDDLLNEELGIRMGNIYSIQKE